MRNLGREGVIVQTQESRKELILNFEEILRVTYMWPDEQKLIITGRKEGTFRSVFYHLKTGMLGEILTSKREPVYKCTLIGDQVVHAKILDEGFENRVLVSENYIISNRTPISIATKI